MILSVEADEKTGKTTFAYSAPTPIVGFGFDIGAKRAIYGMKYKELFEGLKIEIIPYEKNTVPGKEKWAGNDITIFELPRPIQLTQEKLLGFMEQWGYFINPFNDALMDAGVRTVVVDTMTLARRIKCDAYLQELQEGPRPRKQLLQIEYGHPNDSIRNLYDLAQGMGKNLIATHHLTDEYKSMPTGSNSEITSVATGKRILEGLNGTYRHVDVGLRLEKDGKGGVMGKIIECGYNIGLTGTPISNPTWNSVVRTISMSLENRIEFEERRELGIV